MNKLRRIFKPTIEEEIEDLEKIRGMIEKNPIGGCPDCKNFIPPPIDLPGFVTDYGDCKLNKTFFSVKVCGLEEVECDEYEQVEYTALDLIDKQIESLKEKLKNGKQSNK